MKTKIINIIPHPPAYEAYRNDPKPEINWDVPDGEWAGIWGYSWPDQLGNAVLSQSNKFDYEVWQPDLRADKIYSHTYGNGLSHYLFPGQKIVKYMGLKKTSVIISDKILEQLFRYDQNVILHLNNINNYFNYLILENTSLPSIVQIHSREVLPSVNRFKIRKNILKNIYYNKLYNILKNKDRIALIYNNSFSGVKLSSYNPLICERLFLGTYFDKWVPGNKTDAKRYYKCNPDVTVISVASRLVDLKQIDKLIEIFNKLDEQYHFRLLIAGNGSPEYEKYLFRIAEKLINKNKLEFLGYVKGNDLLKLYQASDLFISSSTKEGGPVSVMNAVACEVPVLCTRVGGVDDIMAEYNAGILVNPFDYKQWEKELIAVMEGKEVKILDREIARQYFHWPNIARRFVDIYRKLEGCSL